jgi:hypothetical protein
VSLNEKCSNIHQECVHKLFWLNFLRQTPWVLMCIKYSNVTRIKCPNFAMYTVEKSEIYGNGGPFIEHGSHWMIVFILIFKSEKKTLNT